MHRDGHLPSLRRHPFNSLSGLRILALALFLVGTVGGWAAGSLPPLPVEIDPLNADHRERFEPVFGTPWTVVFDPEGTPAFYMGTQLANIPDDTFTNIRYVLLAYGDLANPELYLESRGGSEGSGNPSHYLIFGWQDYRNYYYVYVAESTQTRIARVVNGVHETLYNHGKLIWVRDRDWYQSIRVALRTANGSRVLDTYVNDDLVMSYTFAAGEEPPAGRVGIGMWNLSHSAFLKNIRLAGK